MQPGLLHCRFEFGKTLGDTPHANIDLDRILEEEVDGFKLTLKLGTARPYSTRINTKSSGWVDAFRISFVDVLANIEDIKIKEPTETDFNDAFQTIGQVVSRLFSAVRCSQPWTGLAGSIPDLQWARSISETGEVKHLHFNGYRSSTMWVGGEPLTSTQVQKAIFHDAPVPSTLLAQSLYFGCYATDRQPALGVLLGALSCEIYAKQVLRDSCHNDLRDVLDILVPEKQQAKVAAHELFGRVSKIIMSRSLKDENSTLYSEVSELFTMRNKIAHRGYVPSTEESWRLGRAAAAAFEWLES